MLKKFTMSKKAAKFKLADLKIEDKKTREDVKDALEQLYVAGFDLAVSECRKENSKYCDWTADFLEDLTDEQETTL